MSGRAAIERAPGAAPAARGEGFGRRAIDALPVALVLLAEGAWIAVVYTVPQAASGEPVLLGPLAFALAAGGGLLVGRTGPDRLGRLWPAAMLALVVAAGLVGWVAAGATRDALLSAHPGAALATHRGGWLLGLAFLRGIVHARRGAREAPSGSLVTIGVPAIVVALIFGGMITDPTRSASLGAAIPDTILFIGAGLVGLALARIRTPGGVPGLDWRRNPAWFGVLLALVAAMLLVAVPVSFALGPLIVLLMAALPVPLLVVGLLGGLDRRGWRLLLTVIEVSIVLAVVVWIVSAWRANLGPQGQLTPGISTPTQDQAWTTILAWLVLIAGVALLIGLLLFLTRRRSGPGGDRENIGEERTIDRGGDAERRSVRLLGARRRRRIGPPRDAPEAYLAALAALAGQDDLRRLAGETPAEHARRVRQAMRDEVAPRQRVGPSPVPAALGLLAADYELARFGGRTLTPGEHHRGLGRWESIRRAVRSRHPSTRAPGAGDSK